MSHRPPNGFDPIHDPAHLRAWCQKNAPHIISRDVPPVRLAGGLMNEVWRISAMPRDVVFKWAPPYVASAPEIALSSARLIFEARALDLVGSAPLRAHVFGPTHEGMWRFDVPEVHLLDVERAAMLMAFVEDARALDELDVRDEETMGALYEGWGGVIGRLHARTSKPEWRTQLEAGFRNMAVQRTRAQVQYSAARAWLGAWTRASSAGDGEVVEDLSAALEKLGERLIMASGACLVMGDSWPRSLLVDWTRRRATLIDWEFAHFGQPAQDVGHVLAHIWMMGHVRDERARHASYARRWLAAYEEALYSEDAEALISALHQRQSALHYIAEVLARTLGGFVTEACYAPGTSKRDEAVRHILSLWKHMQTASSGHAHDCLLTGM